MTLDEIKEKVRNGEYKITKHALEESENDEITIDDTKNVIFNSEIIEEYPDRFRCLIFGKMEDGLPLHLVCEYYDYLLDSINNILIVTVYIPSDEDWINYRKRKR